MELIKFHLELTMKITATKYLFKTFGLIAVTALLGACSSIPVSQDYSANSRLVNHSTYQWLPNSLSQTSNAQDLKRMQPFIAQRIEKAIMNNLHARGAMLVRYSPQAYISYGYRIQRTQSLEPSTTIGFGFGSGNVGFGTSIPIDYETQIYEDAIWTVDIYDSKRQLVWRGEAKKPVQSFSKPADAQRHTQQVIDAIMKQYPPK